MIKFLDLHAQYLSIKGEVDKAIFAVINDSEFIIRCVCMWYCIWNRCIIEGYFAWINE